MQPYLFASLVLLLAEYHHVRIIALVAAGYIFSLLVQSTVQHYRERQGRSGNLDSTEMGYILGVFFFTIGALAYFAAFPS